MNHPRTTGKALDAGMAKAKIETFSGAGHLLFWESAKAVFSVHHFSRAIQTHQTRWVKLIAGLA